MSTVQLTEDQTYVFKATDFTTGTLAGLQITSLPTTGTLELNGVPVTLNQTVYARNITAGNFIFVPNTDVTAPGSFNDVVGIFSNGALVTTSSSMTLNVTADTGPSASSTSVQVTENQTYTFKTADFGYSDSGDKTTDSLGSVVITSMPADGTLYDNNKPITSTGTAVSAADINSGLFTFVPNSNATGTDTVGFQVTDGIGKTISKNTAAVTLHIVGGTATDTGPTAVASTVQVTEDVTYTFKASDFHYSDSFDPGDGLASVTINSLPTTGTLKLGVNNVTAGEKIAAASIATLTFVPTTDVTNVPTQGSFSFSVTDTTGGITSSAATMTLNVTADTGPSASSTSVQVTENQPYTFKTADFGYSDFADKNTDPLGSVTITSLPSDGTLQWKSSAVTLNQSISAADISNGLLTFVPNTNVTTAGSFGFKVSDSLGGTTSGTAATMTLNIAAPGNTPSPQLSFAAQNFNTVGTDNSGYYMIPPDPNAAVGSNTVITATNGVLETFNKSGVLQSNTSLDSFFMAGLGSLVLTNFNDSNQSGPFDPKVIYDPYTNRFIVVALQESDAGGTYNDTNTSNILLAVSSPDTGGALTWKYTSINSDVVTANNADCWADYPGLAVDGTGNIYITANLFDHATGNYQGSRLWTVSESAVVNGNATAIMYDPSVLSGATSAGSSELFTLMPAQMLPGSGAFATPSGTYLVSYDGAQNSQGQVLNIIQVTPQASGSPTFTYKQINLGNIDAAGQFASFTAPQLGTTATINADDDRVYSAVFRNGYLYAATTIIPTSSYDSANAGETTAHWFQINANSSNLTLVQQGDVSGASIGSGVRTYYPSISVDANGDFAIGFSASGPNNYASAYYEAYKYNATTNTWTLDNPTLLAGGVAPYYRTFGNGDNRWGDFSSVVADPSSPSTFWVYNEYAWTQGTTISGENGRWATQVGEFTLPNTTTGPVVGGGGTTGSSQSTASTNPSTSNPGLVQLADASGHGHGQTSDINPNANPLVESDHGAAIAFLPPRGHGPDDLSSQLAGSLSQLVQTMAAFGAGQVGIPSLSGTGQNDVANPSVLAANLFHHYG